jgi:hypothetical protein
MPRLDGEVRVMACPTALPRRERMPSRDRFGRHPQSQATALLQRLIIFRVAATMLQI